RWPADAPAQRWRQPEQLDRHQVHRDALESIGDWRPREGDDRRPQPDRRGHERLELLLAERSSAPLRPRKSIRRRDRRDRVAVGGKGDLSGSRRQPVLRDSGSQGHRQQRETGIARMRALSACVSLLLLIGPHAEPDVQFVDVTKAVGLPFVHQNSATSNKYLLETMGGGVALLDYDNDGRLDMFLTNGAKIDDPMPD